MKGRWDGPFCAEWGQRGAAEAEKAASSSERCRLGADEGHHQQQQQQQLQRRQFETRECTSHFEPKSAALAQAGFFSSATRISHRRDAERVTRRSLSEQALFSLREPLAPRNLPASCSLHLTRGSSGLAFNSTSWAAGQASDDIRI